MFIAQGKPHELIPYLSIATLGSDGGILLDASGEQIDGLPR